MNGHGHERKLGEKDGIRRAITWLHARAGEMNDPHAKAILNSAAFSLGVDGKHGRLPPTAPVAHGRPLNALTVGLRSWARHERDHKNNETGAAVIEDAAGEIERLQSELDAMNSRFPLSAWQPIETVPEGQHVLLFFPRGERGIGGIETATVFRDGKDMAYWTHGGPNSGSEWFAAENELPTHWMPLPASPSVQTPD